MKKETDKKVFIMAEAGVNHNGDIGIAKKLIDAAAAAGADAVKFQTFKAKTLATGYAFAAPYQKRTDGMPPSQYAMLKKLELSEADHRALHRYCKKSRIKFMSSAFDIESVDFLSRLGLDTFKIPSGEIDNLPYLRQVGRLGKKVMLSTGMSDLAEVRRAVRVLTGSGTRKANITILHCVTEYPAPCGDVNLNAMVTMRKTFGVDVGYSDHTRGIEIPIAAAALGASVIEKHFTLDRRMRGPDHGASLEPAELTVMIRAIRNVELAMGDGRKRCAKSEEKNKASVRKSIVAFCNINKGELLTERNLAVKRPSAGLSPVRWYQVVGKRACKDFKKDELIKL